MPEHGSRTAALVLSATLLAGLAGAAVRAAPPGAFATESSSAETPALQPGGPSPEESAPAPTPAPSAGAACRTAVERSRIVAYCHNPYPEVDVVRLHAECARWWDVDADGAPVAVGPAETVRLSGRCWKEVGSAWVSHARAPDASPPPRR